MGHPLAGTYHIYPWKSGGENSAGICCMGPVIVETSLCTEQQREKRTKKQTSIFLSPPALGWVHTQSHENSIFLPIWLEVAVTVLAFTELVLIGVCVKEGLNLWWVEFKGPKDLQELLMGSSSADSPAWPPLILLQQFGLARNSAEHAHPLTSWTSLNSFRLLNLQRLSYLTYFWSNPPWQTQLFWQNHSDFPCIIWSEGVSTAIWVRKGGLEALYSLKYLNKQYILAEIVCCNLFRMMYLQLTPSW